MDKPLNKEKHNILTFEDKVIGGGLYFLALIFLIINSFVFFGNGSNTQSLSNLLFEPPKIKVIESEKDTNASEKGSKSITFFQARQMISDDGYIVLDYKIMMDGKQFMFLTDDGLYCQIMFINGTLPKEKVKYVILEKGNLIDMKNIWDTEVF